MPRDIEEFLKMAAKRRQQQKQGGKPAAGRPETPAGGGAQQKRKPPKPGQPTQQKQRRSSIRPATDDEIVIIGGSEATPDPYHQSVSDHVSSHIDTKSLGEHASQLGEEVALADDKLVDRLHGTFDHKVGHLKIDTTQSVHSTTTTITARQVSPIADDLLQMLSNPVSIRQAILITEVLKRPDFDD